ncbi:MAG: PP2C family protein-serine/threonine phosphatase [Acidobacteria bacterium]|nr:PP2C family protein-serine/threonine phosphatase [Acidobacteriota bacterium]MBI3425910.1 PP2C family protein-serine/threonine phosphatase [Acidobacteriota bacterium]
MRTETVSLKSHSHTSSARPVAHELFNHAPPNAAPYSKLLAVLLVLAGIGIIAYVDAVVRAFSLGFLYIFPLAFGAIVMGRRATLLLVLLCVFLVDELGPYEHLGWESIWRNLISLAGYLAVVLIVSKLVQQRRSLAETVRQQRDEMVKEIAQAALIQRRMLPQCAPLRPGIDLAARMESAKVVAGDYYDFIELEDGKLGLVVADVAGKGVPAGLLVPTLKTTLRLEAPRLAQCQEVVASLNQLIYDVTDGARYVTIFYARLNPPDRTLQYTNGGHLPGLWYRAATREIAWLDKGGISPGLFQGVKYESAQVQLASNDILVLYSDGITEAENRQGDDFGRERLARLIVAHHTRTAEALLETVFTTLTEFTEHQEPNDDQTLLILKIT